MAYKVFSNGNTLNGSELNTYLMNQAVISFASTTARDAAITSPLEGQLVWLEDTNKYVYYTGSAWTDLIVPTNTNAIINGAFDIWQRGTSGSSSVGTYGYGPDRFAIYSHSGTSGSWSQQTFTPGTAPVTGYESTYFARFTSTNTSTIFRQPIEDVRTFAGQTVTLSFWMKAASAISLNSRYTQEFGSGGSAPVDTGSTTHSITTSWARYTATVTLPAVTGKTIGAGSSLRVIWDSSSINTAVDIWGVQLEAGSVATAFKRNSPNIEAELGACQRYYWRVNSSDASYAIFTGPSSAANSTTVYAAVDNPKFMRGKATAIEYANLTLTDGAGGFFTVTSAVIDAAASTPKTGAVTLGTSGLTTYRPYRLQCNNNTSAYLAFSVEL